MSGLEVTPPRDACRTQQNDKEKCGSVLGAKIIMQVNKNIQRNVVVFWDVFWCRYFHTPWFEIIMLVKKISQHNHTEKCGSVLDDLLKFSNGPVLKSGPFEKN